MIIDAPEEWHEQPNKYRTSTEQVPNKFDNSTGQVQTPRLSADTSVTRLVNALGHKQLSVREMLEALGMKHRPTFLKNYLEPALDEGLVTMRYPESPRHPRQKYLLTVRGAVLYNQINQQNM